MVVETDKMDTFELMTYFIAALGVIVLCLCVVVASILIYHFCRSVSIVDCITVSNILHYYYFVSNISRQRIEIFAFLYLSENSLIKELKNYNNA